MKCNIPMPDLPARLDSTICLYQNKPVIIRTEGSDSKRIYLYDIINPSIRLKIIDSDDPDLDIGTPPLGYCQYSIDRVCFITRRPQRQFKQGIYSENCYIEYLTKGDYVHKWSSQATYDMMTKKYQSFEHIFSLILQGKQYAEYALNNDIAFSTDGSKIIKVFFRNEEVGFIIKSEDIDIYHPTIIIPKSRKEWVIFKYLSDFNFKFK